MHEVCGLLCCLPSVILTLLLLGDCDQMPNRLAECQLATIVGAEEAYSSEDCNEPVGLSDPCGYCFEYLDGTSKKCDALGTTYYQMCESYTNATGCLRCICTIGITCPGDSYKYTDTECKEGEQKTGACGRFYSNCSQTTCKTKKTCPSP